MLANSTKYWDHLFELTNQAAHCNEIPVAALIAHKNKIIASAHNLVETHQDPTQHAELIVIKTATKELGKYLNECDLYVSLEPCPMCAHAIQLTQIRRVYFGAYDPQRGGIDHGEALLKKLNRVEAYGGFHEQAFNHILKGFFNTVRNTQF